METPTPGITVISIIVLALICAGAMGAMLERLRDKPDNERLRRLESGDWSCEKDDPDYVEKVIYGDMSEREWKRQRKESHGRKN